MYAIVEIQGQQFKAEEGKKLFVHHIKDAEEGKTVEFDKSAARTLVSATVIVSSSLSWKSNQ